MELAEFFYLQRTIFWIGRRSWLAWFCVTAISKQFKRIERKHCIDNILGLVASPIVLLSTWLYLHGLVRNYGLGF